MNHVKLRLFALSVLLVSFPVPWHIFADASAIKDSVASKPATSPTIRAANRKSHTVKWKTDSALAESVLIPDSRIQMTAEYALDSVHFGEFSEEEQAILKEISRLGVQISFVLSNEQISLRYSKPFGSEDELLLADASGTCHEIYVPSRLALSPRDCKFWRLMNQMPGVSSSGELLEFFSECLRDGHIFRASLLLMRQFESFGDLSVSTFSEHIFVSGYCGVLKHFLFRKRPKLFMERFIEVYCGGSAERRVDLDRMLTDVLIDLKVSDGLVQLALDTAIQTVACPIRIFAAFMACQRPVVISEPTLKNLLTNGIDNMASRLSILAASKNVNLFVSILKESFSLESTCVPSDLAKAIFSSKQILELFTEDLLMRFAAYTLKLNRLDIIQMVFTAPFVERFGKLPTRHRILFTSITKCSSEVAMHLVDLRLATTNIPLFTRKELISAAFQAIVADKTDLVKMLLVRRLLSPYDRIALKDSDTASILGFSMKKDKMDIFDFIKDMCGIKINWRKCPECIPIMKTKNLLDEYVDPSYYNASPNKTELPHAEISQSEITHAELPHAEITPPSKSSLGTPESLSQSSIYYYSPVFPTPSGPGLLVPKTISPELERKATSGKPQLAAVRLSNIYGEDDVRAAKKARIVNFATCLERRDEKEMKMVLCRDRESLLLPSSIVGLVDDLCNAEMYSSLTFLLKQIRTAQDLIKLVLVDAVKRGNKLVLKLLLALESVKLTDQVVDRNVIAQLLKFRQSALAFDLIKEFNFNVRYSDSPETNPHGDILLSAVWSAPVMEQLLRLGASPQVVFESNCTGERMGLLDWARSKGKAEIERLLLHYRE
jgi:hypothetical protein